MRQFQISALMMVFSVLITGCGFNDADEGIRDQPNSFPPTKNPTDDFTDSSTGDSSNSSGLEKNEVRVTVEAPERVAPEGEATRRNLRIATPEQLNVYRTNSRLQQLSTVRVQQRLDENGRDVLEFPDGQPLGPDVIIEVVVGNTRMRALASDSDRDIKVNPFSEYLVRNALGSYSAGEFNRIMECVNSEQGEDLCVNKFVWSTLSDQIQDFEINIPSDADLNDAMEVLAGRADFASYVDSMAGYALLDGQASGDVSALAQNYNTVFLGVELGQSFVASSSSQPGQWGTRVAREELLEDELGIAFVYPGLTLTAFDLFNIRITSLVTDIPYDRVTLAQTATNEFFSRPANLWDLNTQSTAPGAATTDGEVRLLAGRSLYQSITGRGSSTTIGWTRNPFFQDAFLGGSGDGPDRVLSSYFSAGKAIELESEGGELKRKDTLEEHYVSAFELHLERSDDFDLTGLSDRNYNLVTYSAKFSSPDSGEPVRIEAGVGQWSVGGNDITQTLDDVLAVARDSNGLVSDTTINRSGPRLVSQRTSRLSTGDRNTGRLNLDISSQVPSGGNPAIGVGASNPDGTFLAFNLVNDTNGNGLLIAAPQATEAPEVGRYRVQGLSMAMSADTNRLSQYQGATLTINNNNSATLSLAGLDVRHNIAEEEVLKPSAREDSAIALAYSHSGNGQILLTAGDLQLKGFASPDQSQLFLRISSLSGEEKSLGLIMATRLP